jgi:hypothetical protein
MHHLFGADTMEAGLGLCASSPYLALESFGISLEKKQKREVYEPLKTA